MPTAAVSTAPPPPRPRMPDWDDFIAPTATRCALQRLVDEHRAAPHLASYGLRPRQQIVLVGPPDCGQSFLVDRLADLFGTPPQSLSLEAWAAQDPATQWSALDAWAASGALLVLRHASLFGEPSAALRTIPAARRFLAWWNEAPVGPTYVVRDVAVRPSAGEVARAFPDAISLDKPTPEFMESFVRERLAGWTVDPNAIVRLRQPAVGLSFGDLARMMANAQKAALLTATALEDCLLQAMNEEERRLRGV